MPTMTVILRPSLLASYSLLLHSTTTLCSYRYQASLVRLGSPFVWSRPPSRGFAGPARAAAAAGREGVPAAEDDEPPPTWRALQEIVRSGALDQLKRRKSVQRRYDRHRVEVLTEWGSMYDYILHDKLGLPPCRDADGRFRVEVPSGKAVQALTENSFPYHVGSDVDHWILWKLGGDCTPADVAAAERELRRRATPRAAAFLHWVNPPRLQSLPEIAHTHILMRRGAAEEGDEAPQ